MLITIYRVKLVRLGHPARLLPQVLDSALDAQVCEFCNYVGKILVFVISKFYNIIPLAPLFHVCIVHSASLMFSVH